MDKFLSNPAGRLYRFLEHCEGENGNDTVIEGWRRYLDLPGGASRIAILGAIAPLFVLPDHIADLLRSTEHAEEDLEDVAPALDAARAAMSLAAESTSQMVQMQKRFNSGHVQALKSCSRVLQRLPGAAGVPEDDQLAEVRDSAQALIDSINNATHLPDTVRETLLGYAHSAIRDVDLFKVGGIDALEREANRFRGQVELSPGSMLPPLKEKGIWVALKRFATALEVVVIVSHAPIAIAADVEEYKQAILSISAEMPAEIIAPAPAALEAPRSGDPI
ncbi:hypothetical protein NYQ25_18575 [Curtobacterium flaccumfaciens pv. flaccumfaciens]|uniref:hypothetical protein n=1 Tax=Curtobacterium flaccumfaciens TaxID=2035 RepID=UPI00217EFEA9|nr:hypothetical protein [Curtobacterium flaccumfaciens]MCS6586978.1 hypothetical protein [Curtobacterium flaccumfaciens pv. flaccumfaciens]